MNADQKEPTDLGILPNVEIICSLHASVHSRFALQFSCAFEALRSELLSPTKPGGGGGQLTLSRSVSAMAPSMTVGITDLAIELKRQGAPLIMLSVGEPDFPPSAEVLSAAHAALENGHTKYTSMAGLHELRQAICEDLSKRKVMKTRPEAPESDTHTLPTPVLLYMRADPALESARHI